MQLLVLSGPTVSRVQLVVTKSESVPSLQAATGVGPVVTVLQVMTGRTPGALGTHAPATPTVAFVTAHVLATQLFDALGASSTHAVPGVSCVGPVVATLQDVTFRLASVPGVHAATSVGPVSTVEQLVVTKLASVPSKQLPA